MDLFPGAAGVLGILNDFEKKKALSTFETIRTHVNWEQQGKDDQALTGLLKQLVGYELATHSGTAYSLTKKGSVQLKQSMIQGFSAMMLAAEQSAVSKKFCQQVYGIDLCQFNMMSRAQLDKLLEELNLGKDDHNLDLGCGVGLISEYVSDVTGAAVFGIDFATEVIERARERTVTEKKAAFVPGNGYGCIEPSKPQLQRGDFDRHALLRRRSRGNHSFSPGMFANERPDGDSLFHQGITGRSS